MIIQKAIKAGDLYYVKHLTIINAFLPEHMSMTSKEIDVLAAFMEVKGELVEDDRFNSIVRKKVMAKLGYKPAGLSNYLGSLIKKDLLVKNEFSSRISIQGFLIPQDNNQAYQFKITQ